MAEQARMNNFLRLILPHHTSFHVLRCIFQPSCLIVHYYPTFYPTFSYPLIHWLVQPSYLILPHPTTGLFSPPTLSYPIIHPTTAYHTLHLIVPYHTSYYILPRPTPPHILPQRSSSYTGLFSHPTLSYILPQPSSSYTGLFLQACSAILPSRTPSYHNLLRPTLDCSAILPYRTLSYSLLHFSTSYPAWLVQPSHLLLPRPTTAYQPSYPV